MARKKKEIQMVMPTSTTSTYKYKEGNRVVLVKDGNSKYDGTGRVINKTSGLKYVQQIMRGATYPYHIILSNGKLMGYFKEDALSKI